METIKKLEQESKEYHEKWRETEAKIKEEKLKKLSLNFTGKFIVYTDTTDDTTTYMYVRTEMEDKIVHPNLPYSYCLRGFGFSGEFFGYSDNTWFDWDYGKEIYIYATSVQEFAAKVDRIKEVSPEEFDKAFEHQWKDVLKHHKEYYRTILFGKNEDLTQE